MKKEENKKGRKKRKNKGRKKNGQPDSSAWVACDRQKELV